MVQDRGLNAVSFQQLADAVGLSKPSVFHHFPNKEALALALIERWSTKYGDRYQELISRQISAPEKLRAVAAMYQADLLEGRLCLLASLGSSVETLSDGAKEALSLTTRAAIDQFAQIFAQGRRRSTLAFEDSPEEAAMGFLAMVQGLQVLVRAKGDYGAFSRASSAYIESLRV